MAATRAAMTKAGHAPSLSWQAVCLPSRPEKHPSESTLFAGSQSYDALSQASLRFGQPAFFSA